MRGTPGGAPFYGAPGMAYGGYGGHPFGAYYGQGAPYPYYPYYGQVAPPYPPSQPPSAPASRPRPRNPRGASRRPPPPAPPSDGRPAWLASSSFPSSSSPRVSCDVCNLFFKSASELSEHVDELHVSCEVEGCRYSAPLDLMAVHGLKHAKNQHGELVLDSAEETRKWIENRRNRHPLSRRRHLAVTEDSTLERLLREAHRKHRSEAPARSLLYPAIAKVRARPSALLHLSDPLKYRNLVRQSFGPYSYRPSLSMSRSLCQSFKRTRTCRFGDRCQYSHDVNGGGCNGLRDLSVTKRPPTLLHVLKKDIYCAEKTLVNALKTIVALGFFDVAEGPSVEAEGPGCVPSEPTGS